jgi:hypothetical protein
MAHRHSRVPVLVVVVSLAAGTLAAHVPPLVGFLKSIVVQPIHRLGGLQISAMADKTLPPGIHELAWHAGNGRGKSPLSSIYA